MTNRFVSYYASLLCLMLMNGAVVLRPRGRRQVIKINRYRDRMKNDVGSGVRDEAQVGPDQGRLDRQRYVEGTGVVQREDRHPMRRRGRWLVQTCAIRHRRRARLHPLGREPLLNRALEFIIRRPTGDGADPEWRAV